ncbi:N-acetylglucosamine-6-phosphate deacetylase-like [Sycon ciliatum]|uniref:N-acetylglucosamine-6-phosphate deacetylase-like n=1 Tax=Sycon ciliatum TaxID=27933 RepID=UPI0020AEACF7|eukprot:scpid62650/ scgid19828/ Putative N-acetylglucosamine-6-phosphate deacetylase; Amidohydrolase domain-containing protein 2; GlcNAc 6-P deacetylase
MAEIIRFTDCHVLREKGLVKEDLWVRNGKIADPLKLFYNEKLRETVKVNCKGGIVAPGFIDVQINGAYGFDFSSDPANIGESLRQVSKRLLRHGVTAFCPTVVTSSPEMYRQLLPHMKRTDGGADGAAIIGVHLEGPFISKEKKGAHNESFIQDAGAITPEEVQGAYGSLDNASIVTVAPELNGLGDCSMIQWLSKEQNVCVSLGHSIADLKVAEGAVACGARFITHLFNAMLPFHHRDPGLVGLLSAGDVFYGVIADGVHTHKAALHLAYHSHPNGLVLVSDAMAAAGLGAGYHKLGTLQVHMTEDADGLLCARLADQQETLAGSVAMLDFCVRWFHEASHCSQAEALRTASTHPASLLKLESKGSLDIGKDADLVILDQDLNVERTFIAGQQVWPEAMCA